MSMGDSIIPGHPSCGLPTISYIITLYNKSDYITHVLDSIYAQNIDNPREIIIVNDGSTDNSLIKVLAYNPYNYNRYPSKSEVLDNFLEKNPVEVHNGSDDIDNTEGEQKNGYRKTSIPIRVISKQNAGPSSALNTGLKCVSGSFICFVDADDVLLPDATKIMLENIEKHNVDVVFGKIAENYRDINDLDSKQYSKKFYPKPIKEALRSLSAVGATRSMAKTEIIKRSGGCNESIFTQDYQLTLKICRFADFLFIDKYLAYNLAPKNARISYNKQREVRDINLSLLDFLLNNRDLDKSLIKFGLNRCIKRLKRFRKINNFSYLSLLIQINILRINFSTIINRLLKIIYL